MVDEAFALSPISARAAQPNEEDYAAIYAAFMETSRGRWFLGEYAKRNRNADTRLVLDAVARIEDSLAAQKQAAAEADLAEALAAIRNAVGNAQTAASAGLDRLAFDEQLAPIAKAVRIIREISWRWRETGADGRICDILDSQVAAIEGSSGQISAAEARTAVDQAFAAIAARIDEYALDDAMPAEARREASDAADANVVPFPAPAEELAEELVAVEIETAAVAEAMAEAPVAEVADAPVTETADEVAAVEPAAEAAPIASVVGAIEVVDEADADAVQANAHDEAVLDLIAAEMSAPQPLEVDVEFFEPAPPAPEFGERDPYAGEIVGSDIETVDAVAAPVVPAAPPEPPRPAPSAMVAPATTPAAAPTQIGEAQVDEAHASIGAAVLASGILNKPKPPANDPLAPIRRMSQAERIAFFS
ncbi:hypothetical protein ES703_21280 [subsurface metagenome]|nr:MAG: hypothetical protein DI543_00505 [Bradyrhizobium icense]